MGSFDDCPVCGKHHKSCKHLLKEHLPDTLGKALCGRKDVVVLSDDWVDRDIDPTEVCKHCVKQDAHFQYKYKLVNGEYQLIDEDDMDVLIWEE